MDRQQLQTIAQAQLTRTLVGTAGGGTAGSALSELGELYEGKVRDCYITKTGYRVIVVTDRLSAFDRVLTTIPFKGQVLNQLAAYWFELASDRFNNHVSSVPDPNVMIAHECKPLAAEFVMRSYLTGVTSTSIWRAYERGDRTFCGHSLPEGMVKNQRLPEVLLTPSTKAAKGDHDVSVSREQLLEMTDASENPIGEETFDQAAKLSADLFAFGQARALERGMILVDTKYEIGVSSSGELTFIDEIHTPDSSRYWYADSYEQCLADDKPPKSLDKEYVRRWLAEEAGFSGDGPIPEIPDEVRVEAALRYIEIYELITGRDFVPETTDPNERIRANLASASELA